MAKLTNAIREDIAKKAAIDLFAAALLAQFDAVKAQIIDLVKDQYKEFDFEHVEPYRGYIQWHDKINLASLPGEWETHWDEFKTICGLSSIDRIDLSFEIPSNKDRTPYLESKYNKQVENILRPYMINYLTGKKAYSEIKQVLRGLSTYKQVEEALPELVKYLPENKNGMVNALVPIEQINRVKALFNQK